MVKYEYIIKAIKEYLQKCPATLQAKKIGSTGRWTTETDQWGEEIGVLTYENGTTIKFNKRGIVDYYNENEIFYPDMDINLYDQGESIDYNPKYTEGIYVDFTHFKMSAIGVKFNEYLRGICTKQDFYDYLEDKIGDGTAPLWGSTFTKGLTGKEMGDFFINNNPEYEKICNEETLNGYGDFITARKVNRLHDNDNINKRIVSDKGYTSSTIRTDDLGSIDYALDIDTDDSWTIITEYHNGNPANHGIALAYAEIKNGFQDWNEIINPPHQKFKRNIIDEKNKIIVQEAYEP